MNALTHHSLLAALTLAAAAAFGADMSRVVDDFTVHLGVMPLAAAATREASAPSEVMHGHARAGKTAQHVVVALYDTKSGQRISDAQVSATVTELGFDSEAKPLLRMTTGGVISWGNTFEIKPGSRYTIKVAVRRAGVHVPVETSFDYARP